MYTLQNLKNLKRWELVIKNSNILSMITLQAISKKANDKQKPKFSQIKRMFCNKTNEEEMKIEDEDKPITFFKEWRPEDSLNYFRMTRKWFPNVDLKLKTTQSFRVMTYNALAECYLGEKEYKGVSDEVLSWRFRHKIMLKELDQENFMEDCKEESTTKPDIICFQEFQDTEVTEYLTTKSKIKYEYESKAKARGRLDHIAIFWNSDLFEKLNSWSVSMDSNTNCEIYSKPQIGLFVALRVKKNNNDELLINKNKEDVIILVCNTHLIFNNNRGDIKLAQIDLITKTIQYLKDLLKTQYSDSKINVVLTGDFNCIPNSGIYNFVSDGKYDCFSMKKNEISGQKFAFVKPNYEHDYIDLDVEVLDTIEQKHEKFRKVSRKLYKLKDIIGSNTPYWMNKIKSTKIVGYNEQNEIKYEHVEDTKEHLQKMGLVDIALKRKYNVPTTDKNDK